MPVLEVLHLSGNGLTGTIPIPESKQFKLTTLSLSYNQLTGTIPSFIQAASWNYLDLSYNKFNGVLQNDFPVMLVPNTSGQITSSAQLQNSTIQYLMNPVPYLYLAVNRLSGDIPNTFFAEPESTQMNVLDGNLFACNAPYDLNNDNLPNTDTNVDTYSCGTDSVNLSLYLWMLFAGLTMMGGVGVWYVGKAYYSPPVNKQHDDSTTTVVILWMYQVWKQWQAVAHNVYEHVTIHWWMVFLLPNTKEEEEFGGHAESSKKERRYRLYQWGQYMKQFRALVMFMTLFSLLLLMPSYCIMSSFYSTHTYAYAWTVSVG